MVSPRQAGYCYLRAFEHDYRDEVAEALGAWPELNALLQFQQWFVCKELQDGLNVEFVQDRCHFSYDGDSLWQFSAVMDELRRSQVAAPVLGDGRDVCQSGAILRQENQHEPGSVGCVEAQIRGVCVGGGFSDCQRQLGDPVEPRLEEGIGDFVESWRLLKTVDEFDACAYLLLFHDHYKDVALEMLGFHPSVDVLLRQPAEWFLSDADLDNVYVVKSVELRGCVGFSNVQGDESWMRLASWLVTCVGRQVAIPGSFGAKLLSVTSLFDRMIRDSDQLGLWPSHMVVGHPSDDALLGNVAKISGFCYLLLFQPVRRLKILGRCGAWPRLVEVVACLAEEGNAIEGVVGAHVEIGKYVHHVMEVETDTSVRWDSLLANRRVRLNAGDFRDVVGGPEDAYDLDNPPGVIDEAIDDILLEYVVLDGSFGERFIYDVVGAIFVSFALDMIANALVDLTFNFGLKFVIVLALRVLSIWMLFVTVVLLSHKYMLYVRR